jgi:iron complex transport system substrate-binding protein
MIPELGMVDAIVGVSDECRWPPEVIGKPVVSASKIKPSELSSLEIDAAVRDAVREGASLYVVDADLIEELAPELIVTQDLCSVCAVSGAELAGACPVAADVLSLDPRTLGEVIDSVRTLARRIGADDAGDKIVAGMRSKLEETKRAVAGLPRRRVFFAEWLDPPFCAGHWLPEMIELAGGRDVLGRAGEPSRSTTWNEVLALEPELIVLGACGFGADEAARRAAGFEFPYPAFAVDGDAYYSRPAPRLADGVRQLAHLMHPETSPDPGLPEIRTGRLAPL